MKKSRRKLKLKLVKIKVRKFFIRMPEALKGQDENIFEIEIILGRY
jgi:hypothetical protein